LIAIEIEIKIRRRHQRWLTNLFLALLKYRERCWVTFWSFIPIISCRHTASTSLPIIYPLTEKFPTITVMHQSHNCLICSLPNPASALQPPIIPIPFRANTDGSTEYIHIEFPCLSNNVFATAKVSIVKLDKDCRRREGEPHFSVRKVAVPVRAD
jgi:hypothetical protein